MAGESVLRAISAVCARARSKYKIWNDPKQCCSGFTLFSASDLWPLVVYITVKVSKPFRWLLQQFWIVLWLFASAIVRVVDARVPAVKTVHTIKVSLIDFGTCPSTFEFRIRHIFKVLRLRFQLFGYDLKAFFWDKENWLGFSDFFLAFHSQRSVTWSPVCINLPYWVVDMKSFVKNKNTLRPDRLRSPTIFLDNQFLFVVLVPIRITCFEFY